jgi:hypothetical protein
MSTASNKSFFEISPRARARRYNSVITVLYIGNGQPVRIIGQAARHAVRIIDTLPGTLPEISDRLPYYWGQIFSLNSDIWVPLECPIWDRFRSQIEHIKEGEGILHKFAQFNFVFFRERSV